MNLGTLGHLTYCSNIHPGESWQDVFAQLRRHLPALRRRLSPEAPFGIGLRLSAAAATELLAGDALPHFRNWLARESLYVFTLNGFPYGEFHGSPVKQAVYRPDWSRPERLHYTRQLGEVLAALLPEGVVGSISTVPGAFRADVTDEDYRQAITANLVEAAAGLRRLELATGRRICLALEPEPGCMLETTTETVAFFRSHLYSKANAQRAAQLAGEPPGAGDKLLRAHLGLCLDTCHAAVMFEEPLASARQVLDAGITLAKLQLTAALAVDRMNRTALTALQAFADPVYLHQTSVRSAGRTRHYLDLEEACDDYARSGDGSAWRSHYHVPIFLENLGHFRSTAPELARLLAAHRQSPLSGHLEVETYTFDLLPVELRLADAGASIERELAWVRDRLLAAPG